MNKPSKIAPAASPAYESDGYGWAMAQGALLRNRRVDGIDWDNVAEEIETMGRSERTAFSSQLIRILVHMLKWEAQPERRGKSWWLSIMNGRIDAQRVLNENPSLKPLLLDIHADALSHARLKAALETDIDRSLFDGIDISLAEAFERQYSRPESD